MITTQKLQDQRKQLELDMSRQNLLAAEAERQAKQHRENAIAIVGAIQLIDGLLKEDAEEKGKATQ